MSPAEFEPTIQQTTGRKHTSQNARPLGSGHSDHRHVTDVSSSASDMSENMLVRHFTKVSEFQLKVALYH